MTVLITVKKVITALFFNGVNSSASEVPRSRAAGHLIL